MMRHLPACLFYPGINLICPDTHLPLIFAPINATMFHGWSLQGAVLTTLIPWEVLCDHNRSTSRFIASIRGTSKGGPICL